LDARLTTLLCKKEIVAKSKEVKAGWSNSNPAEASKEACGSKGAVLPITMTASIRLYNHYAQAQQDNP
jgi:hypothetical protein